MAESVQSLKKRIKSVGNIKKITKAMELVAATKMRRSQEIALASRPYAFVALDLLANLKLLETEVPELLKSRKIKKVLFVLVASDKGLAGAFNSSLFKKFESFFKKDSSREALAKWDESNVFVSVGEKSFQYLSRKKHTVVKKFTNVGDFTAIEQVQPLADFIVQGYLEKSWDQVVIFSTHFKSALKQEAMLRHVLPINFKHIKETLLEIVPTAGKFSDIVNISEVRSQTLDVNYTIEPSTQKVLENLAQHLLFMQVYHLILEANASEHSARRMAMKTAADNASDLAEVLNLQYNKSRQSAITTQIIEISSGAEALN